MSAGRDRRLGTGHVPIRLRIMPATKPPVYLFIAAVALVEGSAFAQTDSQTPTPAAPLNSVPGENLSEKLNRSNGVIHPREVDPAIEKAEPKTRDQNVVPPPGTSGGAPAPQSK